MENDLKEMLNDFKKYIDTSRHHSVEVELHVHHDILTGMEREPEFEVSLYGFYRGKCFLGVAPTYREALADLIERKNKYDADK